MPVPTAITDLSTTAASNSPAGSDSVFPNLDDYLRTAYAFIAQNYADKLALAGGTMTGALTLSGAPASDLHASTKKYVDDTAASAITASESGLKHAFCATSGASGDGWFQSSGSTLLLTEKYDSGSTYNPATGVFTAPVNGVYCFNGGFGVLSAGTLTALIAVNGNTVSMGVTQGPSPGRAYVCCSYIGALSAGDTVALKTGFAFTTTGSYIAESGSFSGHILWRT